MLTVYLHTSASPLPPVTKTSHSHFAWRGLHFHAVFFLVCGILFVRFHLSFFVGIKTRYNWTVTQSHITTPTTTKQPIELRNIHILQIYFWQCHEHPSPNSHSFTSPTLSKDVIDILEDMLVVHERCWSVHLTCIFLLPVQQISRVFQISKSFDHDRRRWIRQ